MLLAKTHAKFKSFPFALILTFFSVFIQNVSLINSFSEIGVGVGPWSLVILLSVNQHFAFGATIRDGKLKVQKGEHAKSEVDSSVGVNKIRKIVRGRVSRQLSLIAPALQTMGCLPKFFCGMNSKAPSGATSTLNDLAYLVKFAMLDDIDDSGEKKGKDGIKSSGEEIDTRTSDEIRKEQLKFDQMAEEKLIEEDPEYLNFIWKDMKSKIKSKWKDGKMDESALNQMIKDIEKDDKKFKPVPSIFSGLKNLVRLGRSANVTNKNSKPFWETEEFDNQMTLAARVGRASGDDEKCTTSFSVCPYTVSQMKSMITGEKDASESEELEPQKPEWYDNHKGPQEITTLRTRPKKPNKVPKPKRPPTTPNPLSNAIYIINPESHHGLKPSNTITQRTTTTTTTTRKPTTRPTKVPKPHPILAQREPQDDESGFDSELSYNQVLLPPRTIQLIKFKDQKNKKPNKDESDENTRISTWSEEEGEEKPLKIPPKPKSKLKDSKTKKKNEEESASSEEKESKEKKTRKTKIGIPRPKYAIKHKYRNNQFTTDEMMEKKKEAIAASIEASEEEDKSTVNSSDESEEQQTSKEIVQKKQDKFKPPQKYIVKNPPKNKLKFKKVEEASEEESDEDQNKKKAEIDNSSEEKTSSEEDKNTNESKDKRKSEIQGNQKRPPAQPRPTPGGLLANLFGGKRKRPQNNNNNNRPSHMSQNKFSTRPHNQNSPPPYDSNNESLDDSVEKAESKEDSSEEKKQHFVKKAPPQYIAPQDTPPAYGVESETKKPERIRPVIIDPDDSVELAEVPPLPEISTPRTTPIPISSTTPVPTNKKKQQQRKDKDDSESQEEEEEEEENSESKEDDNKSLETKESEEIDPANVKNLFLKSSSVGSKYGNKMQTSPPKIAHFDQVHPQVSTMSFNNLTQSQNAQATLSIPSLGKTEYWESAEEKQDNNSDEDKEDDSTEGTDSKELDKQSEENESGEDDQDKKTDDDELENKEEAFQPVDDDIPQLGAVVVSLKPNPSTLKGQSALAELLPAPALAPVSNVDIKNEIKIPQTAPGTPIGSKRKPTRTQDDPTKTGANAASPGGFSGGFPGGSPGGLSNPAQGAGNQAANQAQGANGANGANRAPGSGQGGNRRPGGNQGGNRRPGQNMMNMMNGNNQGNEDSSEESSVEEIGKSSEEKGNATSEEDEDEDSGRSGLKIKKKSEKEVKKSDKQVKTSIGTPTYTASMYPPLPPIYNWQATTVKKLKPKTSKPKKSRLSKPKPTKDTFYTKPLSPKLVQYLRETYGNSFLLPKKKQKRPTFSTTTAKPKKIEKKRRNSFTQTFKISSNLGGNSDVIHLDDDNEDVENYGRFGHRTGLLVETTKISRNKAKQTLPPIYGKLKHNRG